MYKNSKTKSYKQLILNNCSLPNWVKVPNRQIRKDHMIGCLKKYWPCDEEIENIKKLNIKMKSFRKITLPLKMVPIDMPYFAYGLGKNNIFYIPEDALDLKKNQKLDWRNVDWWLVTFLLMECVHERAWEYKYGSIHSYSWRLNNWDNIVWDYAWVNRIAIFIRFWALNKNLNNNYGYQIVKQVRMTHDLDAVQKTMPIVIKQTTLSIFNFLKSISQFKFNLALNKLIQTYKFLFAKDDWDNILKMITKEKNLKFKPLINIHVKKRIRGPLTWLLDPSYEIKEKKLLSHLREILSHGCEIGLHPGFFSFSKSKEILREKIALENSLSINVFSVRQHWLKFCWEKTWDAQYKAGLVKDFTVMFNDRSGFRNSSALNFSSFYSNKKHHSLSTSFMDSHDFKNINHILKEINLIRGETSILWHSHTISEIYGWESDWEKCLELIKDL